MLLDEIRLGEFRNWILEESSLGDKSREIYPRDITKIEGNLRRTGLDFKELDAAWNADGFESLIARLKKIRTAANEHGPEIDPYTIGNENYRQEISTAITHLKEYSRFLTYLHSSSDHENPRQTNLILYGPPGVGKTYTTAEYAVKLCGEDAPEDRRQLMARYRKLMAEKRIEFVTFHQSMSYEEFVEGLRPRTPDRNESAGFELVPKPGIFRRMAKRAGTRITIGGKQVFQMSVGPGKNTNNLDLFDEAISGGYIMVNGEEVEAAERFRSEVNAGDFVVVYKDGKRFRAIGQFGECPEFDPSNRGQGLWHYRTVKWYWWNRYGVCYEQLYKDGCEKQLMGQAICRINSERLDTDRVEEYVNNRPPDMAYVLIIDEINRANVSKVFGELITLLEPDKRLGQTNELTVRLPYSRKMFGVPSNLHILGTMNTADRSIAQLDTALRRRFVFQEMMPDPESLETIDGIDLDRLLETINRRIEYLYDREHQIGHAYFIDCKSREDVDAVMRDRVIPLLKEYFFDDLSTMAAVLGYMNGSSDPLQGPFLTGEELTDPREIGGGGLKKVRWEVHSNDNGFDYEGFLAQKLDPGVSGSTDNDS